MIPQIQKVLTQNSSATTSSKTLKQNNPEWTPQKKALMAGGIISTLGLGYLAFKQMQQKMPENLNYQHFQTSEISTDDSGLLSSWFMKGVFGVVTLASLYGLKKVKDKWNENVISSAIKELPSFKEKNLEASKYEEINKLIDLAKTHVEEYDNKSLYGQLKSFFEKDWPDNKLFGESLVKFHSLTLEIDRKKAVNLAAVCQEFLKSSTHNKLIHYFHKILSATANHTDEAIKKEIRRYPSLISGADHASITAEANNSETNASEKYHRVMNGKMHIVSEYENDEGDKILAFINELKSYNFQNANYDKINEFIEYLKGFYGKGFYGKSFMLAKMSQQNFKIACCRNLYDNLKEFFVFENYNNESYGKSLRNFHSLALEIDYTKAIILASFCALSLSTNAKPLLIPFLHEIINATVNDPLFKEHVKDYSELVPFAEIASGEGINSFIESTKTFREKAHEKSDYEEINKLIAYLGKINTLQKEEKITLDDSQHDMHDNLTKSLCTFFESNCHDDQFFGKTLEDFFSMALRFYPKDAEKIGFAWASDEKSYLHLQPYLQNIKAKVNLEDIEEGLIIPFAIACAEKADDSESHRAIAEKGWSRCKDDDEKRTKYLAGCAKINNDFCQAKILSQKDLFLETGFNQHHLNLFDACLENLFDENSKELLRGNKAIVATAYENFLNKDSVVQLKLSNSLEQVQTAYSRAGFILPLDVKDELPDQCALELFNPLFNCLLRTHGRGGDALDIEKLLRISKKFNKLESFYNQSIEILRQNPEFDSVISNLSDEPAGMEKNNTKLLLS